MPTLVYTCIDPVFGELVRTTLEQAGIAAQFRRLTNTDFVLEAWAQIWVTDDDQVEAAREIVATLSRTAEHDIDHDGAQWTCPGCHESVPDSMTVCWSCGRAAE